MISPPRRPASQTSAASGVDAVALHEADLVEYARTLYARLRQADAENRAVVVAVRPPAEGLGHAIGDRLTKAAATRPR